MIMMRVYRYCKCGCLLAPPLPARCPQVIQMSMLATVSFFLVLLGYGQREIIEPLWTIQQMAEEEGKKFLLAAASQRLLRFLGVPSSSPPLQARAVVSRLLLSALRGRRSRAINVAFFFGVFCRASADVFVLLQLGCLLLPAPAAAGRFTPITVPNDMSSSCCAAPGQYFLLRLAGCAPCDLSGYLLAARRPTRPLRSAAALHARSLRRSPDRHSE